MVRGNVSTYCVTTDRGDDGLVELGDDLPVGEEVGRVSFGDWKAATMRVAQKRVKTGHYMTCLSFP